MKRIFLYLILSFTSQFVLSQSPAFAWADALGGVGDDFISDIVMDGQGNFYIVGSFSGMVDFDPSAGISNQYSVLLRDAYVAKYSSDGALIWAKTLGGNYHDSAGSVNIDQEGNVYVCGSFVNTVDFDPNDGIYNLISEGTFNSPDAYILKLNSNGEFISAMRLGSTGSDYASEIVLDNQSNIYVYGKFYETVNFGSVNGNAVNLTSNGNNDLYVCKFNPAFELQWAKSFGSGASDSESASSLALDADGNVFICGAFPYSIDFDPGAGEHIVTCNGNDITSDIFILKLDNDGNFVWVNTFGSSGPDSGHDIVIDPNGNLLVTGYFTYAVDFDPNKGVEILSVGLTWTPFVLKLDNDGNFVWVKSLNGSEAAMGKGIATDSEGNAYTTGWFRTTMDFDPGANEYSLTAQESDIYILKLTSTGDFVWAKSLGGLGLDQGNEIRIDSDGAIYTTGGFEDEVNFNTDSLGNYPLTSHGSSDFFVHKMSPNSVGINESVLNGNSMVVYPNPMHDVLHVLLPSNMELQSVEVRNAVGQLCKANHMMSSRNSIQMDTRQLTPGVYFLKVITRDGNQQVVELVKG